MQKVLLAEGTVALAQPQAITGLGGIGKTQAALAYACEHRERYQAVLWVTAEAKESLVSGFVAIAGLLDLPEKDAQDQQLAVAAVHRWLESEEGWLLVLDNADDLEMVQAFIPDHPKGHLVLTTRAQATGGLAQALEVNKMPEADGALLLLRRAKMLPTQAALDKASKPAREQGKALCQELDGLPLALDQAGAYIEETGCGLAGYLELYRTRGDRLLAERGQVHPEDHPASVATTWSLSFEKVENASPAAAELLQLCAFLHADEIPEEIFTVGGEALGPVLSPVAADSLAWNRALGTLLNYSLLQRNAETQTLDIHRLVQAVLKAGMDGTTQGQWAERAVRAVNSVFPGPEFSNWPLCERLLPQALRCSALIEAWGFKFEAAGRLLNQIGSYLQQRARYEEAEPLYQRVLNVYEKVLGPEHPHVATSLNNLAMLYDGQGRYEEAEPLYQRSLAIREQALGPKHPHVGQSLNNLAALYDTQGRYEAAEPLYRRALSIAEQALGPEHPDVGTPLNNLALLYRTQGRYEEAEPLFRRALSITEKALGPEHPSVGTDLNNLAALYDTQGRYEAAEPLLQRALSIAEQALGPEHPRVGTYLNNLAVLYRAQGRYEAAEPLYQRALAITEKALGPEHPDVGNRLNNLALLYHAQGRYEEAEPLLQRALAIAEQALGPEHPDVVHIKENYAHLLSERDRALKRPLWKRLLGSLRSSVSAK